MQNYRGLWLPEGDTAFIKVMNVEGMPLVDGKPTYQHRKYVAAKEKVKRFGHAVDIGAHAGMWSRIMVHDFEHVTAFEPVPEYNECYVANLRGVGNYTLHTFALGAEEKTVSLKIKAKNSGVTHIVNGIGDGTMMAHMRTLDSFDLPAIDFLKIDCEGYEYFVVKGGENTIKRDKPAIVIEQKPSTKDRYGLEFQSALALLQEWGATRGVEIGGDHVMFWGLGYGER